jgi:hypothetical protein
MAGKRRYTKRSDYWQKFKEKEQPIENLMVSNAKADYEPQLVGESFYNHESKAYARSGSGGSSTTARRNNIAIAPQLFKYANIRMGMLPFEYGADGLMYETRLNYVKKLTVIFLFSGTL